MKNLFSLFVNDKYKPKQSKVSLSQKPKTSKKAKGTAQETEVSHDCIKIINRDPNASDPAKYGIHLTSNYLGLKDCSSSNQGGSGGSGEDGGGGGYDLGGDSGSSSDSGSGSGSGSGTDTSKPKYYMSKRERNQLYHMKDSNVPYYYPPDENDLMYLAASEKRDFAWTLKEEIFLYTMHDRQKHRYITSFDIDSDANSIVTSCQVSMPYNEKLMEYYIPGKTTFAIIGGVYDREVLFIGRVSEVNQSGDSINVTGQNIGWKFKQYMSSKFEQKLQNLPVPLAVKAIFKELKFTEGKYHMDLWAIPNVFKYKLDEDLSVTYKGETVYNVPELTEVVSRMKKSDINEYVASRAKVRSTQQDADAYDKVTETKALSSVVLSSQKNTSSFYRKNYGITTSIKEGKISYDTIDKMLYGKNKSYEYFTEDHSGSGEHTYEEVLSNIAAAIDAQFFIVDTTVCFVSFNALMAMSSSETIVKSIQPRIEYWQLLHDSVEIDVNQYGYYNTVIVKYKNGTVKRSFEELVRVYDEIPITYNEPTLNYEAAQLKAQAYLAAHVRDFGMQVRATILYTGKITVASFIKLQNPLTMSETLMYVYGMTIQWDAGGQTLTCDLDLRYGPENPDNPEVPEYGMEYTNSQSAKSVVGSVSGNVTDAAQQICGGAITNDQRAEMIYDWFAKNVKYRSYWNSEQSVSTTLQRKSANCVDSSLCFYELCTAAGIPCEIISGHLTSSDFSGGHWWCKVEYKGSMVIADVGRGIKRGLGKYTGRLTPGSVPKKNY